MKKFRYRLEPILRLKEHLEKEKQKVHSSALQQVYSQKDILQSIDVDRLGQQDQMRLFLEGSININCLTAYNRYFSKLQRDEFTGRELLRTFYKNAEEKRLELVEATKQRKIYEKLKEKHREYHKKETNMASQKEQDEIAGQIVQYKKSSRLKRERKNLGDV